MKAKRVALVTGAGSGIGKAAALALLRDGYHVALVGRRKDRLEQTAAESGARDRALVLPADNHQGRAGEGGLRQDQGGLGPARRPLQQCGHGRAGGAD
jgi:NADP-dependent 3-hydroxy acid dehydrogenase YdfG